MGLFCPLNIDIKKLVIDEKFTFISLQIKIENVYN